MCSRSLVFSSCAHIPTVRLCVSLLLFVPLGALLRLWFGSDPGSRVGRGGQRCCCCCEAVGGFLGQLEDFGWVGRLDVMHSSTLSLPHSYHPEFRLRAK